MNAFEKVIGYDTIKDELLQVCDMIKNREIYESLGAKMPNGILLDGDPGLGKTLMAKCFIEESGLPSFTLRRSKSGAAFIDEISATFQKAKENAPSIVFLDDMDKFANEDNRHCDAEEYVAVQAGIDEVKGSCVFVLATVNNDSKLPDSLTRSGRFDRKIQVQCPTKSDAELIIAHFLKDKKISDDVNLQDLSKMIRYSSCAELETILNEAAIYAAHDRKSVIEAEDFIRAVLRMQYDSPDVLSKESAENIKLTALHEAGHLVACESLCEGSVGLASLRSTGRDATDGFIHRCKDFERRAHEIVVLLAGKAAVELYYSETVASGCQSDISRAVNQIRGAITASATNGFGFVDLYLQHYGEPSQVLAEKIETAIVSELERYYIKTKDVLLKNRDFLEKVAAALEEKGTLVYSDIQKIRSSTQVTAVAI